MASSLLTEAVNDDLSFLLPLNYRSGFSNEGSEKFAVISRKYCHGLDLVPRISGCKAKVPDFFRGFGQPEFKWSRIVMCCYNHHKTQGEIVMRGVDIESTRSATDRWITCLQIAGFVFAAFVQGYVFAQSGAIADGGGNQVKGTIISQTNGDIACYLELRSSSGKESTIMADFELCERHPNLQGKQVELGLSLRQVMDESCGGNLACKRTQQKQVATSLKILGTMAPSPSKEAEAKQASHCTATESVIFACRTGTKLVSVCADPASGPNKGYMQYRFGKPGNQAPLEIIWPESWLPPRAVASGNTEAFSGGGAAWLRIPKGKYAYVVYTGIGRWGPNGQTQSKAGIVVESQGKVLATLKCSQPVTSELGPDWFNKVGIQSRGEDFDLPE